VAPGVGGLGSLDLEMPPPPLCIVRWVNRDGADQPSDVALRVDATDG